MDWKKVEEMLHDYWVHIVRNLSSCEECVCRKFGTECIRETCEENILRCWFETDGDFENGKED